MKVSELHYYYYYYFSGLRARVVKNYKNYIKKTINYIKLQKLQNRPGPYGLNIPAHPREQKK